MFGFSFAKLVMLVLLLAVVWFAFRYASRVDAVRRALREELQRRRQPQQARRVEAEDLVKCAPCGAYVAARGAANCGRADCPWGG